MYGLVRNSGCLISKTNGEVNIGTTSASPTVRIFDEVLYEELTLNADMIIVGEGHSASKELDRLCDLLSLEKGPAGFLQADNVLRSPCLTNRKGILAVGPSVQPMSRWDREQSIKATSVEIHGLYKWLLHSDHPETVEYNQGNCAFCLTCYRACPHGAIHFTNRPFFLNLACQQCGICTSACPGEALRLIEYKDINTGSSKDLHATHEEKSMGSIMAFACKKSAAAVLSNWDKKDTSLPPVKWSEVPCAGIIKLTDIMDALSAGDAIAGVLVLACHEGNCRSGDGTLLAKKLVVSAKEILDKIGCEKGVVEYISTAPNDGIALTEKIKRFWENLHLEKNDKGMISRD
jgi:coenzyme F420-reducing hydrogenase delta subunit/ferredoxin